MSNHIDPINVTEDFYELMSGDVDLLDDSLEIAIPANTSSDKENSTVNFAPKQDDSVEQTLRSTRRAFTNRSEKHIQRRKTRSVTRSRRSTRVTDTISIDCDDDDDFTRNNNGSERLPRCGNNSNKGAIQMNKNSSDGPLICLSSDEEDSNVIQKPKDGIQSYVHEADIYNEVMHIKINWIKESGISYKLRRFQPFKFIYQALSKDKNVDVNHILLSKEDISIRHSDTPDTINLDVKDILIGAPMSEQVTFPEYVIGNVIHPELRIVVMTHSVRKNKKIFTISQHQPFYILFLKISEQLECHVDDVLLSFDGDKVSPESTPDDLQLDGDECFELTCKSKKDIEWDL